MEVHLATRSHSFLPRVSISGESRPVRSWWDPGGAETSVSQSLPDLSGKDRLTDRSEVHELAASSAVNNCVCKVITHSSHCRP
ncbi:hypothetical protein JOQ06_008517, partial [Pogonophryne albipinna]